MRGLIPILIGASVMLAGCGEIGELEVEDAWVRLPAVAGRPAAAYFHLRTGARPETLVEVTTPAAKNAEIHESMTGHHGMARMTPLKQLAMPAATSLTFEPGGKHVMLFELSPELKPGSAAPLRLRFASGATLETGAMLVGAGDPAPAPQGRP